jgi:hypothetical protein
MKQYTKNDPEYRDNGYYVIEGAEYMSIWTYKNRKRVGVNRTAVNGQEARALASIGTPYLTSKPDFGNFDQILIYPVEELNNFYN